MSADNAPERVLLRAHKFSVESVEVETQSGARVLRERIVHPGSVVILPCLDDGRLVLIENPRFAVGETLLELPAGTLVPGEEAEACAYRELLEETGYRAERLEPLLNFYSAPGFCSERMYCFRATGLVFEAPAREETEQMENVCLSVEEIESAIRAHRIVDAKTIATFLYWRCFGLS